MAKIQLDLDQPVEDFASDLFTEVMVRLGRDHQWGDSSVDHTRWKMIAEVLREGMIVKMSEKFRVQVEYLTKYLDCGNTGPGEECRQRNETRPDGCFRCYRQQMTLMDELVRQRRLALKTQDDNQNEYVAAAVDLANQAEGWRQEGRRPDVFDAALDRWRRLKKGEVKK